MWPGTLLAGCEAGAKLQELTRKDLGSLPVKGPLCWQMSAAPAQELSAFPQHKQGILSGPSELEMHSGPMMTDPFTAAQEVRQGLHPSGSLANFWCSPSSALGALKDTA